MMAKMSTSICGGKKGCTCYFDSFFGAEAGGGIIGKDLS